MNINDLPKGYHVTSLLKEEILTGIECKLDMDNLYFKKLARRRHDDICIISCAAKFNVKKDVIESA